MTAAPAGMPQRRRASPYIALLIAIWMAATMVRLYPRFETALRVGGRVTTVDDYVDDSCSARHGPAVEACHAAAHRKARILLRREQAKSALIVVAPAMLYLLYLPLAGAAMAAARRLRAAKQAGYTP
ncbi:MAG: hypothetical protein KGL11_13910 [Alphaproteobacteria bacterium]|nr:hypothetical protein [Alphaproteobacteria bacterium]